MEGGKEGGMEGSEGKEGNQEKWCEGERGLEGRGGSRESDTKDVESSQILNVRPQQGGMQSPQTTICHPTHVYF